MEMFNDVFMNYILCILNFGSFNGDEKDRFMDI